MRRRRWPRRLLLAALLGAMFLVAFDLVFPGPNLGLPVGYHGRYNRIVSRIEARGDLTIVDEVLHRDVTLEDFRITVRTADGRELELRFDSADTRPFDELAQIVDRAGR